MQKLLYNEVMKKRTAIIIGAGPAGLSAAYYLLQLTSDIKPIIIEEENCVGGLSRTLYSNGNGTDIGPHRFFTKNNEVLELWNKLLPFQGFPASDDKLLNRNFDSKEYNANPEKDDKVFLRRKRFSRIYYRKKFFDYPIKLSLSAFCSLGIKQSFLAGISYMKSCIFKLPETNLESFMINRFGRVLYSMFFEGYTQKVWGIHPKDISKEWGEQRIKKISLLKVLSNALASILKINAEKETSLIDEYYYPKYGSSQLWETMADEIKKAGGEIILNTKVTSLYKNNNQVETIEITDKLTNEKRKLSGDIFLSSMPIKDLIESLNDKPASVEHIAKNLQYRDFILVNFLCNKFNLKNDTTWATVNNIAPDSWIYLQDNSIIAGRLDIMNNFSPYMIRNYEKDFVINLEYFCNENDEFWNKSDDEIAEFAKNELLKLNAIDKNSIENVQCYRLRKAYPAYFGTAYSHFEEVKNYIDSIDNLYCIGRNGLHKYNNMDHSILTGIEAARVISKNSDKKCLWDINTDSEYQETK